MKPASTKKRVTVVGGGPAGMAAARIAKERGHSVILFESAAKLGGQNLWTAQIKSRREFSEVTRWLEYQLRKLNVEVRLNFEATKKAILETSPDAVIVATGSVPRRTGHSSLRPDVPFLAGVDQPHVLTIADVFKGPSAVGKNVVLIDEDPHLAGLFTAEYLADQDRKVEVITADLLPLREMHINYIPDIYRRLKPKGIAIRTDSIVTEITSDGVICMDRYTGAATTIAGVDTIVLAMGNEVQDSMAHELKGAVAELYVVGDCLAPRKIEEAILEGERSGWML